MYNKTSYKYKILFSTHVLYKAKYMLIRFHPQNIVIILMTASQPEKLNNVNNV